MDDTCALTRNFIFSASLTGTGPKALEPWDQGAGPHPAKHGKDVFFARSMDAIYPQLSLRTQTHAL